MYQAVPDSSIDEVVCSINSNIRVNQGCMHMYEDMFSTMPEKVCKTSYKIEANIRE